MESLFKICSTKNSPIQKVVYHQIVKTEKDIYYKKALNILGEKGYIIQSVTRDGRRGLLKDLFDTHTDVSISYGCNCDKGIKKKNINQTREEN